MNVCISYEKEGASVIPLTITMHNKDVWVETTENVESNNGTINFYCDWPHGVECFLDFTVDTPKVIPDHITITKFVFDDFWELHTKCLLGTKLEDGTTVQRSNSIFYVGTLRYTIPPRPLTNWLFKQ